MFRFCHDHLPFIKDEKYLCFIVFGSWIRLNVFVTTQKIWAPLCCHPAVKKVFHSFVLWGHTVATVCNCTWKPGRNVETQSERAESDLHAWRTEFLCFKASHINKIHQTVDRPDDSMITDSSGFCIPAFFSQKTSTKVQKGQIFAVKTTKVVTFRERCHLLSGNVVLTEIFLNIFLQTDKPDNYILQLFYCSHIKRHPSD